MIKKGSKLKYKTDGLIYEVKKISKIIVKCYELEPVKGQFTNTVRINTFADTIMNDFDKVAK